MEAKHMIREIEAEQGGKIREGLLQQWHGEPLKSPEIVYMAELSPELKYPQKVVALAKATLKGEEGWVVLDGQRSAWYPKHDLPEAAEKTVLMVHVGRRLLGFEGQPDRQKFLVKQRPQRDPQQIITAYEKLLVEARSGNVGRKKQLLGMGSALEKHFDEFVEAQFSRNAVPKSESVVRVYESMLAAANAGDEAVRKEAMDSFGPLDEHFEQYVDALVSAGRGKQVETLIEQFAPSWDHNRGYGKLGSAAFRCGSYDIAERYFEKLRQSSQDWQRAEEMSLLAEIWVKRGQAENAHALLLECLKGLLEESKTATGSDRKRFEDWFQHHRSTYLRLFPDRGDADLQKNGIPATTLR
jgi:tetratricopeptide (TPR) repeat protein